MCGGYGLHFELDGFEASRFERGSKPAFGIRVIFRFLCSHKVNWPSGYRECDPGTKLKFSLFAQVPENPGDQIFNGVPATENLCAVKSATAQKRFKRLDQSTFRVRRKILLDGLGAGPRLQSIYTTFLRLLKI